MQEKIGKISPIKERILQYIEYKDISKAEFIRSLSMSYENLKGNSLKSELAGDKIGEILSVYEDISPEWLLIGKGDMLKKIDFEEPDKIDKSKKNEEIQVLKNKIEDLEEKLEMQRRYSKSLERQIELLESGLDAAKKGDLAI